MVVAHNSRGQLCDTLAALRHSGWPDLEVIVVDNASTDGSANVVQRHFSEARLIRLPDNVGYGRANNLAYEHASGDLVLLLNPDVTVVTGCIGELAASMAADPIVGAAGPRLLRPDGTADRAARRSFPTPSTSFFRFSGLSRLFARSRVLNRYNVGGSDPSQDHEIDAGTGACLLLRREAIEAADGLFDPDFFMYGEDLDLCRRLKSAGWRIWYVAEAVAVHVKGTSTQQFPYRMQLEFHRAMWIYHRKHHAPGLPAPANAAVWLGIWTRWALLTIRTAVTRDRRVSR